MPINSRKNHVNICIFDGNIVSINYTDEPKPLLELCIDGHLSCSSSNRIHIHAINTLAQTLYPQIEIGDEIHVICKYNPIRVVEHKNTIIPRFIATKIVITEKKLSPIQLSYSAID